MIELVEVHENPLEVLVNALSDCYRKSVMSTLRNANKFQSGGYVGIKPLPLVPNQHEAFLPSRPLVNYELLRTYTD